MTGLEFIGVICMAIVGIAVLLCAVVGAVVIARDGLK